MTEVALFKKAIEEFDYVDLDTANKEIDWNHVPVVKL
jgi:hypothetical protein